MEICEAFHIVQKEFLRVPTGDQSIDATIAEKHNCSYVDTPFGKYVKGLTPTTALQMQAVRQQDGALALLLNTKKSDSIKAAEKYSEMKNAEKEGAMERHMCMDLHH